jgi:signal transduction histidine kinase
LPPAIVVASRDDRHGVIVSLCLVVTALFLSLAARGNYLSFLNHLRLRQGISRLADEAETASQAKSRFLANMSHELRTPLNAIIGFAEMIHEQIKGPVAAHYADFARAIDQSGRHLVEIINDILDLSKIQAGGYELDETATSVAAVVERASVVIKPACETAGMRLDIAVEPDLPQIYVDSRRLIQVLINLLSNAVKFSNPGGSVRIEAMVEPTDSGRCVVMRISDQGIGIPPDEIEEVLKPFVQSREAERRQTPGTALGLPLADEIMRMHGGTLTIESEPGQGTAVTIALPSERTMAQMQSPSFAREIAG